MRTLLVIILVFSATSALAGKRLSNSGIREYTCSLFGKAPSGVGVQDDISVHAKSENDALRVCIDRVNVHKEDTAEGRKRMADFPHFEMRLVLDDMEVNLAE